MKKPCMDCPCSTVHTDCTTKEAEDDALAMAKANKEATDKVSAGVMLFIIIIFVYGMCAAYYSYVTGPEKMKSSTKTEEVAK